MNQLFKVTQSFVEGERHIEVLRTLVETDFTFTDKPYQQTSQTLGIRVGVEVTGVLNPDMLAEVIEVFPKTDNNSRHDRFWSDICEALSTGTFRASDGLTEDYRGCRGVEGRMTKEKRVMPLMRNQASSLPAGLRRSIVERINGMISQLVKQGNDSYMSSARQNLVQSQGWEDLHQQAGVKDKVDRVAALRKEAALLEKEIQSDLNAWMLKDMDHYGWKVGGHPLVPSLVVELKAIYKKGEAFSNSRRMLF